MKSRHWSFLFAALAVAGLAFAAKAASYSLQWVGGGEKDTDGYYHLEDDANWSGGVIKLSDQEVYNLTFPESTEEIKILMPSVDKNFKGDMKFSANANYRFMGNGLQTFEFRGVLSLGDNALVQFVDTTIRFGTGGGDSKISAKSNSLLVFDNCTSQLGSGGTSQNAFAGDMQVLNRSYITVPTFTVASDATLEISGGSTFTCGKNLYLNARSKTVIDDSLFAMTGEKPLSMVGDIVFKGANARFLFKSTSNISGNSNARLVFEVPAGGYNYIPFASTSSSAALPNSNPLHLVVSKESPIYATGWNNGVAEESATIIPLVGWSKGTKSGLAADTPDLTDLDEDVACAWYRSNSATTDALAEGAIPDGLSWAKGHSYGSSEYYIGVYIKGVPGGDEPEEPVEPGQPQPPRFASFAADGSAGDAIAVTGEMGTGGAVTVEVSTTEDFATVYSSADKGAVATNGTFEATFHNATPTAADYIHPGETYYVRAIAVSLEEGCGLAATSKVVRVTTAAGSTAVVTTFTHSSSNVTIVGTLNPKGAGTTEVHILWCEDGIAYDRDVTVATIGPDDDPAWEWSTTLDNEEILFCYKIYAKNSCADASWQTDPVLGKDTDLPYDTSAKYMWVADENGCFDGAWTDRAHWKPVKADGSDYHGFRVDYPDQDAKNVKPFDFSAVEGTNAVVTLPATAVSWGTTDELPGAKNASITLKGTPGKTVVTFSDGDQKYMNFVGETLVLDGLSLTIPTDLRMQNFDQTLVFKDGAVVTFTANNQSLHVQNITTAGLGSTLIVDNATLDMPAGGSSRVLWLGENSRETTPIRLIVRGKHPLLKLTGLHTSTSSSLRPQVIFEIPEGGYAETPIVGYNVQKCAGRTSNASGKAIDLVVDRASYPLSTMTGRKRTYTLIDWSKGFHTSAVSLDDGSGLKKTRELDMYYALADGAKVSGDDFSSATKVKAFVKSPDGLVITVTGAK